VDVPFSEGEKRALTAMLSPQVPDIINLNPAFASTLAERNALLDLTPFLDETSTESSSLYAPALMSYCRFQGKTVALPWYSTTPLLFENTALRQSQNRSQNKSVYQRYPLITSGGNLLKALALQGEVPTTFEAFHARIVSILEPIRMGIQKGDIPSDAVTGSYASALELYMANKLRFLEAGSSALNVIQKNAPTVYVKTRIVDNPKRSFDRVDASPMVLVIPKRSLHPKEAVDFARFITATSHQLALSAQAPVLPSTREGLKKIASHPVKTLSQQAVQKSALQISKAQQGLTPQAEQAILNDLANAVAQSYLLGDAKASPAYLERLWQRFQVN
jgi:putative chitobiose transport system substrate-binding protein